MERSNWIAQVYGYAVCLIAVITFLISVNSTVNWRWLRREELKS